MIKSENENMSNTKSILFMSIGSVVASFGIIWISMFSIISFVLIPALFAFPIVKKKKKLLFIPSVVFLIEIIVVYGFTHLLLVSFLLIILTIIASFGIAAGLLINKLKGSEKKHVAIAKPIGVVFMLIPFAFVANFVFLGNPIGVYLAHGRIETYVNKHYADFDFTVSFPKFVLSSDGYWYEATASDKNNEDISFEITYFSRIGSVDYTYNSGHFKDNYSNVLKHLITPLLEKEFGNSIHEIRTSQSGSSRNPEYYFFIEMNLKNLEPQVLLETIIISRDIIEQNKIPIKFYSFHFICDEIEMRIYHLQTKRINYDLITAIEIMQETFDSSGYIDIGDFPQTYYKFGYSQAETIIPTMFNLKYSRM